MNIDDAISDRLISANACRRIAKHETREDYHPGKSFDEAADYEMQIADWLKELKELRERWSKLRVDIDCYIDNHAESGDPYTIGQHDAACDIGNRMIAYENGEVTHGE